MTVANVFHAGDGNLHPLILYDYEKENEIERAHTIGEEILSICIKHGGTLSGEHGIGIEKAEWMNELYSNKTLENMQNIRLFFNPKNLLNPGKIFPQPGLCVEVKKDAIADVVLNNLFKLTRRRTYVRRYEKLGLKLRWYKKKQQRRIRRIWCY